MFCALHGLCIAHNAAKTTDSVQIIKRLHSPSKHKMSRGILLLCPSREPALIFLWKEKIRVIRGSSCVSRQGVEGLRLNFSPSRANYPLSSSALQSSLTPSKSPRTPSSALRFFTLCTSLSNDGKSLAESLQHQVNSSPLLSSSRMCLSSAAPDEMTRGSQALLLCSHQEED